MNILAPVQVGMVGMGVVGTGVARILVQHADRITRRAGRPIRLKRVAVRDTGRTRDVELPAGVISGDAADLIQDPEISIVVQLMGGVDLARQQILSALAHGKDIVTANKAVLAEHGSEIFDHARRLGRSVAYDAAVAGGIPIVSNIGQCLTANQITSLHGILNGTCNFIISKMEDDQSDYESSVAEAQRRGYAEADPRMDVDGSDAAQKLAILAQMAFDTPIGWREIHRVGIDRLEPAELQLAKELGYRVRLIASACHGSHGLELQVTPSLVRIGTPLAEVRGAYNAISVTGDMVGTIFYHGLGAGQSPTASAVVADLIDTVVGRSAITFRTTGHWSDHEHSLPLADIAHTRSRYYWRITVRDHPGVLAQIAGVMGQNNVSIATLIQRESLFDSRQGYTNLVLMTHESSEGAALAAETQLRQLEVVRKDTGIRLPVLN